MRRVGYLPIFLTGQALSGLHGDGQFCYGAFSPRSCAKHSVP
jgi:hypothetical protein